MITHSFYESDNRVMRYAEALAQRGDAVDVLALRRRPELAKEEVISGVRVFRIQDRFGRKEQSKVSFLWPLLRFLTASSWWVMRQHRRRPYHLLHVHNIPDFLVFAAWYPKLMGAKVVLDIHDIVPEFFASKFRTSHHAALVRALKLVERVSAAFADHVIIANHLWLEKYTARSARREKCSVYINHVDARLFQPRPRKPSGEKQVVLFPGGLQWHQGLDIAVRAFAKLQPRLPRTEFHIYGEGGMKSELMALAAELGLNGSVRFFAPVPIHQMAEVMATADLGVVPKRADSFGNEAYSTKIMEFMSVGVPLVVSDTRVDRFYFDDHVVKFFASGNADALADAMYEVLNSAERQQELVATAREYVARHNWETCKGTYFQLVDELCARN